MLENARLAVTCGAEPALVFAVALVSSRVTDATSAIALLSEHGPAIDALLCDGARAQPLRPAPLEAALRFDPELGRARPDLRDHEIRGRLLFGEMLGKRSFWQVAAWAIGGVDLSEGDGELLGQIGVLTQLLDPQIWPLAVTRRIAASGGGLARALVGGTATLAAPRLAGLPVGGFMRFLARVEAEEAAGATLDEVLERAVAQGERVPGVGRPVLGRDERVAHQLALYVRHGRAGGPNVERALAIDRFYERRKGVRLNSAGLHGALMRDLGFSPIAASAFSTLYFVVPVLAHAAFADPGEG